MRMDTKDELNNLIRILSRDGKMQVFTSSGAGTWGPPLRLGSNPEIVVLQFE